MMFVNKVMWVSVSMFKIVFPITWYIVNKFIHLKHSRRSNLNSFFKSFRSGRLEVFRKKSALKNFAKFTRKLLWQSVFFNKVAGLRTATLFKQRVWHNCFSVNFAKFLFYTRTPKLQLKLQQFLRTHSFKEDLRWLFVVIPSFYFALFFHNMRTEFLFQNCLKK